MSGQPPTGYGAPPGGYGTPPTGYPQQQQQGYGAPPGGYGAPPGGYGAPPGGYGAPPQGGYGAPPQGGYGAPPGGYSGGYPPQGGYGAPQGGYGAPPPGGYGAPQGGYGAPPPGGYGAPPGGYGAPPGGYGAPPGGYGAPPGGYVPPATTTTTVSVSAPVVGVTGNIPIVFMPVFSYPASDPKEDAHRLYKSMKGLGTDDSTLINIMTHRSKQQLEAIASEYHKHHKHSLEKDIRGDTSGNYCNLLLELAKPVTYLKADSLKHATRGVGTRERILIDVLTQSSNAEIRAIKSLYHSAEKDIKGDTSGNFENVLVALLRANRQEITFVDDSHADRVAHELYKAGEERIGTNDSKFIDIMTTYSPYFLDRVGHHYHKKFGHSLQKAIEKETSGYYQEALLACTMPPDVYFAHRIHQSMKGAGTDDHGLIYAFAVHDRAQLKHIESIYNKKYGSLIKDIRHDTSGNYCKTLCSLLDY